jgi:hypothetical protein
MEILSKYASYRHVLDTDTTPRVSNVNTPLSTFKPCYMTVSSDTWYKILGQLIQVDVWLKEKEVTNEHVKNHIGILCVWKCFNLHMPHKRQNMDPSAFSPKYKQKLANWAGEGEQPKGLRRMLNLQPLYIHLIKQTSYEMTKASIL